MTLDNLKYKLEKKVNDLRQHGAGYVARKWLSDHIYMSDQVYILKRDLSLPLSGNGRRRRSAIEIRLVEGEQNLDHFMPYLKKSRPLVERLLKEGSVCVIALVDNAAVAFLWFTTTRFYDCDLDYCYVCKPGEVYQGVFVHQDYRGSPILLEMFRVGWEHFHRLSYRWVVGSVNASNWRSMRVHQRLGFIESGTVLHFTRLFSWRNSRVEEYCGQRLKSDELASNAI